MDKVKEGKIEVKVSSVLLLLVAIIFLVFDIIITKGFIREAKVIGENTETAVLALAYGVTILSLVTAFVGFLSNNGKLLAFLGAIVTLLGAASIAYSQLVVDKIDYVSIFVSLCGAIYFSGAMKTLGYFKKNY